MTGRCFHPPARAEGVRKLPARNGWSCQVPARRAVERDDDAVTGVVEEVWPRAEGSRRPGSMAGLRGRSRLLHDAAACQVTDAGRLPPPADTRS
ncbi:winged helix-turn-helix domain-containing protein [Streptomyces griseoviridis]|uniref:winged helix-turn-helix domain-containing protein n=1 Tax=Streptomyces griseoviridis TaxID=45398 RepID=UPI001E4299B4|nr:MULTISPECIES: winged helix-turn-helix domain-containing protein [Streptomyces]